MVMDLLDLVHGRAPRRKGKAHGNQGKDTIESVITFRIDSRTIKRESHGYHVDRVPLGLIHEHISILEH
jgi:hypothetical protein